MNTQSQNCKYCCNFKIALYGPMDSGFCKRKEFTIEYNDEFGNYERKQILANGETVTPSANNNHCAHFKPMMPAPTREWFQRIFKNKT